MYGKLVIWHKTSDFEVLQRNLPVYIYVHVFIYCSTPAPRDLEGTIFLEDQGSLSTPSISNGGGGGGGGIFF